MGNSPDVQATGRNICAYKDINFIFVELLHNPVSFLLCQAAMYYQNIYSKISEISSNKISIMPRVAENHYKIMLLSFKQMHEK